MFVCCCRQHETVQGEQSSNEDEYFGSDKTQKVTFCGVCGPYGLKPRQHNNTFT